jgi:hypothetical protein
MCNEVAGEKWSRHLRVSLGSAVQSLSADVI